MSWFDQLKEGIRASWAQQQAQNAENEMVNELMHELDAMTCARWVSDIIDIIADDLIKNDHPDLPLSLWVSFNQLTDTQKSFVFGNLLGVIRELLKPPDALVGAKL